MMIAALGRGRRLHVVKYRPDLSDRWRSICGRARSLKVYPEEPARPSGLPPCERCIDELHALAATMEGLR